MKYTKQNQKIIIEGKEDFNPKHILECGQVFCYDKENDDYIVFPQDQYAKIVENENGYIIQTQNPDYFIKYFDLTTDYTFIKKQLNEIKLLNKPIEFGYGIRILKQNLFETLISFIISANNNIKRIQLILGRLRKEVGKGVFPTYKQLLACDEEFFKKIGAGYRANYLYRVLRQIDVTTLEKWGTLDTFTLRKNLLSLCGVGPKVADCILLFGYGRGESFPVDTWIHQMYNKYYPHLDNRNQIRENLVKQFGGLSGYAQQYLFYFQRSFK